MLNLDEFWHIWGGISVMSKCNLAIFSENFNQEVYKKVLNECLIQEANALYGNQWVLQEDNNPVHTRKARRPGNANLSPNKLIGRPIVQISLEVTK